MQAYVTQILEQAAAGIEDADLEAAWRAMGRVAEPIEMGKVAAFLAGPDSAFITGQAIAVDGGYTVL